MSARIQDLRGSNHMPVVARGSHNFRIFLSQARGGSWDETIYRTELDYLKSIGIRQLRMFWSPLAYFVHKAEFAANVARAAEIIADVGLEVQLVLGDMVSASYTYTANPLLHPWYDHLGPIGTHSWNPANATNPGLMNGTDGLLDYHVSNDAALFAGQFPNAVDGYRSGGWMSCPDPLYTCAYSMPAYPAVPTGHESLWAGYVAAMEIVVGALQNEGVLHSLDLINEPTFTLGFAALVAAASAPYNFFSPNGGLPSSGYENEAAKRCARMMVWFQQLAAAKWPDVPTTFGHINTSDLLVAHTWGENPNVGVSVPPTTFWSYHSYGNGRYQKGAIDQFRTTLAENRPEWLEIPLSCNEYGRWEQGEDMLPFMLHTCERERVGLIVWDIFEWPNFGGGWSASHPPNDAPPVGNAYPTTGIVRSRIVNGEHVIQERRGDLLPAVREWCSLEPTTRPVWWRTKRIGKLSFQIADEVTGNPLPFSPSLFVHWRWAIVASGTIPHFDENNTAWRTIAPFHDYRCLGSWLDVPDAQVVQGHASESLPVEILTAVKPGQDLIIQPAFGRPDYNITEWASLTWNEVGYLRLSYQDLHGWKSSTEDKRFVRIYNALVSRARAAMLPVVDAETEDAEMAPLTGELIRAASVVAGETAAEMGERSRLGNDYGTVSESWLLTMRFAKRVSLSTFLRDMTRILLPEEPRSGLGQITLKITGDVDITTPALQSGTNGTEVTITYEATFQ